MLKQLVNKREKLIVKNARPSGITGILLRLLCDVEVETNPADTAVGHLVCADTASGDQHVSNDVGGQPAAYCAI